MDCCRTPMAMIQELDKTILTPSNTLENAKQEEIMNLYHEVESVVELRARAQKLVNNPTEIRVLN